jgi:integrase
MVKSQTIPITKEEMDKLIGASMDNDFLYMFFMVAKTTGRRIGEYYGTPEKKYVSEKVVGRTRDGKQKIRKMFSNTGKFIGGVRVKDIKVDDDGTKLMSTQVLKRKTRIEKDAILSEEVFRLISNYVKRNKMNLEDYLFRRYGYRHLQRLIKSYGKKAGITHNITIHNFRHYFVTELLKKGWHYDKISKLTGHSTPQTLIHYDHVVAKDIKNDALEAIKDL